MCVVNEVRRILVTMVYVVVSDLAAVVVEHQEVSDCFVRLAL